MKPSRIFVAGHRGMVGSALMRRLERENVEIITATRAEVDLRDAGAVRNFLEKQKPDAIVLAAAKVGGIQANDTYPAEFLRDNLVIEANVIHEAHRAGINRLVFLGSSCIYPKFAPQPISEDALLTGPLEPTNEWYAIAKIAGIKLCQAYRRQYGRHYISLMPCNLYGPFDNFDLATSHVMPALMRKFHEAKLAGRDEVVVWGTGTPLREFLHVDDLADGTIFLLNTYDGAEPVNCGAGLDLSIRKLAEKIGGIVGFEGRLAFDTSKPDGTPRKLIDSSRINGLGWRPRIGLDEGISSTYQWFLETHASEPAPGEGLGH
jgi:GDP-L-fucose synthase